MDPVTTMTTAFQQLSIEPAVRPKDLFSHIEGPCSSIPYSCKIMVLEYLTTVSAVVTLSNWLPMLGEQDLTDRRLVVKLIPISNQKIKQLIFNYLQKTPICYLSSTPIHAKSIKRLKQHRDYYVMRVDGRIADAENAQRYPELLRGKVVEYFVTREGEAFQPLCSFNFAFTIHAMPFMGLQVLAHSSSRSTDVEDARNTILMAAPDDKEYVRLLAMLIFDKKDYVKNIDRLISWVAASDTQLRLYNRLEMISQCVAKDVVVQFRLGWLFYSGGCKIVAGDMRLAESYAQRSYTLYPHAAAAVLLSHFSIQRGEFSEAKEYLCDADRIKKIALKGTWLEGVEALFNASLARVRPKEQSK